MERVLLFSLQKSDIKVTIEAYFNADGHFVVEGYDIGKTVESYWGDSDYEYSTTVSGENLKKLYEVLDVPDGSKEKLLDEIQKKFNTNSCYSEYCTFLGTNNIKSEGFSWR